MPAQTDDTLRTPPAAQQRRRSHHLRRAATALSLLTAVGVLLHAGCKPIQPKKPVSRYQPLPLKDVPPYFKESVFEQTDLAGTDPIPISSYGLVGSLRNTGDSLAPTSVRQWMINEMTKRGFGRVRTGRSGPEWQPEAILQDPRYAIVRVDGFILPGARARDTFDVFVSAIPESATSSLSHGELFETDLAVNGAERGGANVNRLAVAAGPVFVNPAYVLAGSRVSPQGKTSLRYGAVLDGGIVQQDRALGLRLRQAQLALAQRIAQRINERFQDVADVQAHGGRFAGQNIVATPQDEGVVSFYVPRSFRGDWEHFAGVVTHLYLRSGPEFGLLKARELAAEAVKKDAPLQDISFAWEGLGFGALPAITPLMTHAKPEVAFAAARAAAFLGEPSSLTALVHIANDRNNPFQASAVETLAGLPPTLQINEMLRRLLDGDNAQVRVAAYQALCRNKDNRVFTTNVRERFLLDIVTCNGPTIVHATRAGLPRLAIVGKRVAVQTPITFSAMDGMLTIASEPGSRTLSIFYRGPEYPQPVQVRSSPELAELVARLAGVGAGPRDIPLSFSYSDIVAILQTLADQGKLVTTTSAGGPVAEGTVARASFVLQDLANTENAVYNAPVIPEVTAANQGGAESLPDLNPNDIGETRTGPAAGNRQSRPQ